MSFYGLYGRAAEVSEEPVVFADISTLNIEVIGSSETSVSTRPVWLPIPEGDILHNVNSKLD
jgi:hypothetical protein